MTSISTDNNLMTCALDEWLRRQEPALIRV